MPPGEGREPMGDGRENKREGGERERKRREREGCSYLTPGLLRELADRRDQLGSRKSPP